MDQLHTWASTLQDHIDKINLDPDKFKDRQDKSKILEIGLLRVFAYPRNLAGWNSELQYDFLLVFCDCVTNFSCY